MQTKRPENLLLFPDTEKGKFYDFNNLLKVTNKLFQFPEPNLSHFES